MQYNGERYLDFDEVTAWCQEVAKAMPQWVSLQEAGKSLNGKPIWLLTIGAAGEDRDMRPAFWLDGGTHASEFTGVMLVLYTVSRWLEKLKEGDPKMVDWFSRHSAFVIPCISPDGFDAMCKGEPFMRSTLRPGRDGATRIGLAPKDLDGDGAIRWMRWRHRAGAFVQDEQQPLYMRPRTLDDDPEDAFFVASEGVFLQWDGVKWINAPFQFGLDLNRNFPGGWMPFSMFGMDGGTHPTSAPESRAVVEAFAARKGICAAVTNHTYTGCLLTQPYRADTPLGKGDIDMMHALATDAVVGTDYDVFKVHPEFMYDPKKPITGVWADAMTTTFGIPGYTLEMWNPMKFAGIELKNSLDFLMKPKTEDMRKLISRMAQDPTLHSGWKAFEHPQLGTVEIGGLDYLRTVRNPPVPVLAEECGKGYAIIDRVRRAVPRVEATASVTALGEECWRVELVLENLGFLPTSGLSHGEHLQATPEVSARLVSADGMEVLEGAPHQPLHHLDGWGQTRVGGGRNAIYPSLSARGHRARATWLVKGSADELTIDWIAGRAGRGQTTVSLAP